MKRNATEQEKEILKKGIARRVLRISEAEESLNYNKKQEEYQKKVWDWEDFSRPVKRKSILKQFVKANKEAQMIIDSEKFALKGERKQLKEGIEVLSNNAVG